MTNAAGTPVESYTYDVYGRPYVMTAAGADGNWLTEDAATSDTSTIGNPYVFTGRRWDSDTKLYYYRFRDYSPELGRFLQCDPLHYRDTMNLYQYCFNGPINNLDPYGLGFWGRVGSLLGGPVGGAIAGGISGAISGAITGGWQGAIGGAVGGAISGALGGGVVGNIVGGAVGGAVAGAISAGLSGGDWGDVGNAALAGAIGGAVGGAISGAIGASTPTIPGGVPEGIGTTVVNVVGAVIEGTVIGTVVGSATNDICKGDDSSLAGDRNDLINDTMEDI